MTLPIRPTQRIEVPGNHLRAVLEAYGVTEKVAVVGIQGFVKSIADAETGKNLIGVYDDALCIVGPGDDDYTTFEGNTDPSRAIVDPKTNLGRASLVPGRRYRYKRGIHGITGPKERQRPAWVQAGPVAVRRYQADGTLGEKIYEGQWIGLNIHDGGISTTGSAGCQTVVRERWNDYDSQLEAALGAAGQDEFWYVLTT